MGHLQNSCNIWKKFQQWAFYVTFIKHTDFSSTHSQIYRQKTIYKILKSSSILSFLLQTVLIWIKLNFDEKATYILVYYTTDKSILNKNKQLKTWTSTTKLSTFWQQNLSITQSNINNTRISNNWWWDSHGNIFRQNIK